MCDFVYMWYLVTFRLTWNILMYVKFEKVKILSAWSFQILRLLQIHNYKTFDSSCFLNLKKNGFNVPALL